MTYPHTVLKTTGSSFSGFVRDEYTLLAEVDDRIFSTSVELEYAFDPVEIQAPGDAKKEEFALSGAHEQAVGAAWDADTVAARARAVTLDVFAHDESASVQVRL